MERIPGDWLVGWVEEGLVAFLSVIKITQHHTFVTVAPQPEHVDASEMLSRDRTKRAKNRTVADRRVQIIHSTSRNIVLAKYEQEVHEVVGLGETLCCSSQYHKQFSNC